MPRADVSSSASVSVKYLLALHGQDRTRHQIFLSSLPNDPDDRHEVGERHVCTRNADDVDDFLKKYDRAGRGVYYCVSTIEGTRRNKVNARETVFLHTDIDFRSVEGDERSLREVLLGLPLVPSVLVRSGRGFHAYWLLATPLDTQAQLDEIEALLKRLAEVLGGDATVAHAAALMRLPGSHNSKEGLPGGVASVEVVIEHFSEVRYGLQELEDWLYGQEVVIVRRAVETHGRGSQGLPGGRAASAVSPPADNPFLNAAKLAGFLPPLDVDQALAEMAPGNIHGTQLRVSASLLNEGRSVDDVVDFLMQMTFQAAGETAARWNKRQERKKLVNMCETWLEKRAKEQQADSKIEVGRLSGEQMANVVDNVVNIGSRRSHVRGPKYKPPALHLILAETLLTVLADNGERLMFTDSGDYRYVEGLWTLQTDNSLRDWLNRELREVAIGLGAEPTNRLINEARAEILRRKELYVAAPAMDGHGGIPTLSGLVDPSDGTIEPLLPEHFATWRVEVRYEPDAACPLWLQMLEDCFADRFEEDRSVYVALLQEWLGLALVDARPKTLSRALIFLGSSNKGKSELIEVLSGLLGPEFIATPLDALDGAHGLMAFVRRLPWVLHEAFDASKWHMSATVKAIISGDPVQANIKNGPMLSVRFRGPILWGTNVSPQFKEATSAIVNRILVVECKVEFDEDQPVGVGLVARARGFAKPSELVLACEREGLLVWALEGLRRVLERGKFLIPYEAKVIAEQIQSDSNIAKDFLVDCCSFDAEGMVSVPDFHAAFRSWWRERRGEGHMIPSSESLGRALKALADARVCCDKDLRDSRKRYYAGLQFSLSGLDHWRAEVSSRLFIDQGRAASTTGSDGNPNLKIRSDWADRDGIRALSRAILKTHKAPF